MVKYTAVVSGGRMSDPMKDAIDETVRIAFGLSPLERKIVMVLYEKTTLDRFKLYRGITICDREPRISDFKEALKQLREKKILIENVVDEHCYLTRPLGYLVAGNIQSAPKLTMIVTRGQL